MIWPLLVLLQVAFVICQGDSNGNTIILPSVSPEQGQRLNVPATATRLVFINFNGVVYEDLLKDFDKLEDLIFQDSKLTEVQPGGLCSPVNLKTLGLNSISVDELTEESFKNCEGLKELEIQYRDFTLGPNVFSNLKNLETLTTAQFKWGELKKSDLNGLKNIKKLSLTDASIDKIHPGTFEDLENLEELVLRNNKIPEVKGDEFRGLSSLTFLNVNYNPTTSINIDQLLENLPKLKKLSVSFAFVPEDQQKEIEEKVKAAGIDLDTY